ARGCPAPRSNDRTTSTPASCRAARSTYREAFQIALRLRWLLAPSPSRAQESRKATAYERARSVHVPGGRCRITADCVRPRDQTPRPNVAALLPDRPESVERCLASDRRSPGKSHRQPASRQYPTLRQLRARRGSRRVVSKRDAASRAYEGAVTAQRADVQAASRPRSRRARPRDFLASTSPRSPTCSVVASRACRRAWTHRAQRALQRSTYMTHSRARARRTQVRLLRPGRAQVSCLQRPHSDENTTRGQRARCQDA